jgi:AhpD family alkylhydroperoxidase
MSFRIAYSKVAPGASRALMGVENYLDGSALEPVLLHFVRLRASQTNGCAYCIDMHSKDLRAAGESEQRLYLLDAWRETPFYSDRERAALAWTEAVTRLTNGDVSDEVYAEARQHFDEKELVDLTVAITAINSWNRLSIAFRSEVGTYQPKQHHAKAA